MTGEARARRALEDGIDVAGLAGLKPVRAGQLESRGQVIEAAARALREDGSTQQREQQEAACNQVLHERPLPPAGAFEGELPVATLAPAPELTGVHVDLRVTGCAIAGELDDFLGLFVIVVTSRSGMSAEQRRSGRPGVVELPDAPAAR